MHRVVSFLKCLGLQLFSMFPVAMAQVADSAILKANSIPNLDLIVSAGPVFFYRVGISRLLVFVYVRVSNTL